MQTLPFVAKQNYLSVIVDGKPFTLDSSHPTFKQLKTALMSQNWKAVPKLVSTAKALAEQTNGEIEVKDDQIFYKGSVVDNSLTRRILAMMREGQPIAHMIKFMTNLFKNPSETAKRELFDFLQRNNLPITDRGTFCAYKRIKNNYTDVYTGTVDNSVGQVVSMPRTNVDPDRDNECSRGYHCCSLEYLGTFNGERLMVVEVNPADVVAVPITYGFSKLRTWRYEVVKEITNHKALTTDDPFLQVSVVTIAKDRKELLAKLLAHPYYKKAIKRGVIKRSTIVKQTFGRLQKMAEKLPDLFAPSEPPEQASVLTNTLMATRIAAGLTIGQVAKATDSNYKAVYRLERKAEPEQEDIDTYLKAVARLSDQQAGLAFPRKAIKAASASDWGRADMRRVTYHEPEYGVPLEEEYESEPEVEEEYD